MNFWRAIADEAWLEDGEWTQMNTPDHSDASPVIGGGCNRLRTYPYFRRKTELLRVVTPM